MYVWQKKSSVLMFYYRKNLESCINHIEETSAKTLRKSEWPAFNLINITEVLLDKKSLVGREFSDLDVSSVLNRKLSTKTTAWKRINC